MLSDLRNLLGLREEGPTGFLTAAAARGEPLARDRELEARLEALFLEAKSEPWEGGRRSWGGDTVKHSSRLSEDEFM